MAWSTTSYPANELTAFGADRPVFVPQNRLVEATSLDWKNAAGSDQNDSDHPVRWLQANPALRSWFGWTGVTTDVIVQVQFPAPGVTFDFVGLINHNIAELGFGVSVDFQVADDAAFTTNVQTVTPWSTGLTSKDRLIWWDGNSAYYTDVEHFRVRFTKTGGGSFTSSQIIKLGCLFVGKRVQLPFPPSEPWDPKRGRSTQTQFVSDGGSQFVLTKTRGLYALTPTWQLGADVNGGEIDDRAAFETIWEESRGFSQEMVWCNEPTSEPNAAIIVRETGLLLDRPFIDGPDFGTVSLTLDEQPPGYLEESVGW